MGTLGATSPSGITDPNGTWVEKTYTFKAADFAPLTTAAKVKLTVVQDIESTQGTVTAVYFDDVFFGLE